MMFRTHSFNTFLCSTSAISYQNVSSNVIFVYAILLPLVATFVSVNEQNALYCTRRNYKTNANVMLVTSWCYCGTPSYSGPL